MVLKVVLKKEGGLKALKANYDGFCDARYQLRADTGLMCSKDTSLRPKVENSSVKVEVHALFASESHTEARQPSIPDTNFSGTIL